MKVLAHRVRDVQKRQHAKRGLLSYEGSLIRWRDR